MFKQLLEFWRVRGDCNVPSGWKENPQLANWVTVQRRARQLGRRTISAQQIVRLSEIGFVWDHKRNSRTWDEMFLLLLEYRHRYEDCNVPYPWPENPQLRWWVNNQRSAKKAGKLSNEQIHRLNSIGFQWEVKRGRRKILGRNWHT